jgi:hypothetical protein
VSAHTPGPWTCRPISDRTLNHHRGFEIRGPETAQSIRDVLENEVEANARIIAAAPELLNGCELGVMMLGIEARMHRENHAPKKAEAVEKAIAVIRAAIAKAEGSAP